MPNGALLAASGKPSTWLPPGRLGEHQRSENNEKALKIKGILKITKMQCVKATCSYERVSRYASYEHEILAKLY